MKLEKIEHKHTLTNILKVALFSLFLMLPFINILARCLYVTCNKNAKDSYYGQNINQVELLKVNNFNELTQNNKYRLKNETFLQYSNVGAINIDFDNLINNTDGYDLSSATRLSLYPNIYQTNENMFITFYNENGQQVRAYNLVNNLINFELNITTYSYTNENASYFLDIFNKYEYNKYSYLDNAFEYSFNNLENETWFNWTKNTAIYNGVNSMTTGLGINNNVISMIITYWLILTTIYIVIDIVINCYTALTHIISGRKAT